MQIPKYFYFLVRVKDLATIEIENASDRDVEEVVRCKDCKYYDFDFCVSGDQLPWCDYFSAYCAPDDYCSRGKREESEE